MPSRFERFELKYFINADQVSPLKSSIYPFMKPDPYMAKTGRSCYTVRSIYFDTRRLRFYFEKHDGLKRRRKLRIRTYNDRDSSSVASFEIKNKISNTCLKERAIFPYDMMRQLVDTGIPDSSSVPYISTIQKTNFGKFMFLKDYMNLEPSVLVTYEREAYVGQLDKNIRVTFDRNIRGISRPKLDQLFSEFGFRHLGTNRVILELKFNNLMPAWMKKFAMEMNLHSRPISKYCHCIDLWNDSQYLP